MSTVAALSLVIASAPVACGDDDNAPVAAAHDGGVSRDAVAPSFDATVAPPADAGAFTIEDVANTPCEPPRAPLREIYPPDATKFRPLSFVAVGARRAMRTDDGVLLMDADGANASASVVAAPVAVVEMASTPNVVVALGPDGSGLKIARFDATGRAAGGNLDLGGSLFGYGAGGGAGNVLVAYADGYDLRAVAYGDEGASVAPPFTFRSGIVEVEGATFAVAHAGGDEFGVAFTGQYAGTHRLVFTRVSTSKRVHTSFTLLRGAERLRLVALARVESRFALLIERVAASGTEILLVLLDSNGRFAAPARRLLGVRRAFGVASSGAEVGVVAWRAGASDGDEQLPDAIEFRPFDSAGGALGSWVCLDEPYTTPTVDVGAAILGEDAGYSIVMRTPKRAVALARIERRGDGRP